MINGIWKSIQIFCGNHGHEYIKLVPHEGNEGQDIFYSCPKYYPENRTADESACFNRFTIAQYERLVTYISSLIESAIMSNTTINLTHMTWVDNGIEYKVISHENDDIKIAILNKKAFK